LNITIYSSGLPASFRYPLPQEFPLHFVIVISSLPQQQIMAAHTPQQGERETESSRTTGTSSIMPPAKTQPQPKHDLVHRDAANAAT